MRGPEIRYRVRSSIDTLERKLRDVRASRELGANKTAILTEQRERLFHGLTEVYLPELGQEAIDDLKRRLPAMHRRVDDVLRAKYQELRRLDTGRDELDTRRHDLIAELDAVTERIETLAVERDRLAETVAAALDADPRHAEMVQSANQYKARREQAQRRHDEAVLERDEKVSDYENDPLFGYLLRRKYDTPEYNPSGLARKLDGWVAGKVNFRRQLEKYRLLLEVPDVAQAGFEADDRAYEQAAEELRGLERSIEDLHGLTQVIAQGEELYGKRQALVGGLKEIDEAIQQATERQSELESTRGPYYEEARDALSDFLESRPIPELRRVAMSTKTRRDDRLAEDLARSDEEWASLRRQLEGHEQAERATVGKLDELRKIDHRLRKNDFDASNSTFAQGFDFDRLLESFLVGTLTIGKLWRAIAGSQRFEPTKYQKAGPVIEAVIWEVLRQATRGGGGGGGWGGGGGGGTTGGFGGFGGGSGTTGGFG